VEAAATYPAELVPGTNLVFQSLRDGNWEIYRDWGSGARQRLTDNTGIDVGPRFSRGNGRVVFASDRDGNPEVYAMNADGSGVQRLTNAPGTDQDAAWSRDGTRLVFSSTRDGNPEIYVMNADGSGQTRLTFDGAYDGAPAWSPDGTRIAFVSYRGGGYRVWVMNADGSGQIPLSDQAYSNNPVWSPDGARIAYDADGDNDGWQELWLMHADGTHHTLVYDPGSGTVDAWANSWSPDGTYIQVTVIHYIAYQGNWYWTGATLTTWHTTTGAAAHSLTDSDVDWNGDWQTQDVWPPAATIAPLPAESSAPFYPFFDATDDGPAGIQMIEVEYREGLTGAWQFFTRSRYPTPMPAGGRASVTYYFRARAIDLHFNVQPWPTEPQAWTTIESAPPVVWFEVPRYARDAVQLTWFGHDPGGSELRNYEVQIRQLPSATWTEWYSGTESSRMLNGMAGETYALRARVTDLAETSSQWPAEPELVTFYAGQLAGAVRSNTGSPVAGVAASATPALAASLPSDSQGAYQAYSASSGEHQVVWHKPGYGPVQAAITLDGDTARDVYLPPADNVIQAGGFEGSDLAPHWQTGALMPAQLISTTAVAGRQALRLGQTPGSGLPEGGYEAYASQVVTVPVTMTTPVLSFQYDLRSAPEVEEAVFSVAVEGETAPRFTFEGSTTGWAHAWLNLADLAGQAITLTFRLVMATDNPATWAALDEISLGSAHSDVWVKATATEHALPGQPVQYVIAYGNQGAITATGTVITHVLPASLEFSAASVPPASMSPLAWALGDFPAGATGQVVVTATVKLGATTGVTVVTSTEVAGGTELETENNVTAVLTWLGQRLFLPRVARGG
jgi:uncharacterized repeat protein (TIGR01451 family)